MPPSRPEDGKQRGRVTFLFDLLAEQRIREAQERGEFADLPGIGAPLPEEDLGLVPEDLRAAYRVLKNAGYVPPEVEARREAASLRALIAQLDDSQARAHALAKLQLLNLRIDERGGRPVEPTGLYADALLDRFGTRG